MEEHTQENFPHFYRGLLSHKYLWLTILTAECLLRARTTAFLLTAASPEHTWHQHTGPSGSTSHEETRLLLNKGYFH